MPPETETVLLEAVRNLTERVEALHERLDLQGGTRTHYSIKEFAAMVGRDPYTVRAWAKAGRIHAQKRSSGRGGKLDWMIPATELARWRNEGFLRSGK